VANPGKPSKPPKPSSGTSPEERADFVVRRLEEFIREKKSPEGMNFKHWQALCKARSPPPSPPPSRSATVATRR
jgi:hypothetical protein